MASNQVVATGIEERPDATHHHEHVKNFLKVVDDMRMPGDFETSDLKKMKRVVREIFIREEALLTKARILQALASGAGEEVKLVSNVLHHVKLGKQRVEEKQKLQENTIHGLLREKDELLNDIKAKDDAMAAVMNERDELQRTVNGLRDELDSSENAFNLVSKERDELETTVSMLRENASLQDNTIKEVMKERDDSQTTLEKLREALSLQEDAIGAATKEASTLQGELHALKLLDEERRQMYELQRQELEKKFKDKISTLQFQLDAALSKLHTFEVGSASRLQELEQKDVLYEKWLQHLVTATKDLRTASDDSKSLVLGLKREWAGMMGIIRSQIEELARQAEGYQTLFAENRKLYNEVLDLKGNIRVYCRVRPSFNNADLGTVDYIGNNGDIMLVNPNKQTRDSRRIFNFHKVFDSTASQQDVYDDTQPLIRSVLDGYNVCIFAYGQTGSGKTYTMSGPNSLGQGADLGVNYRALNDLFMITETRRDAFQYEIGVQMIEIYNEQVRDLLSAPGSSIKKLEIRNHNAQLNVPDACLMSVTCKDDVLELMKIGGRNRAVGATALNERSSRSHSVLTVHVQGVDLSTGSVLRGSLHLVDLAGSERIDKSEVTGERLKEALHINKSLSALGDVIAALAQKSAHVPYRNSKLTQLLQDSLGGQGKALMVVHITADSDSFGETISTLKFAERVATVELGAAKSNREPGEIRELKEQNASLKEVIAQKEAEVERLKSAALDELTAMRTPSKIKRPLGNATGLPSRRLSKDNLLGRRPKPSPGPKTSPEGGFGSTNVRFLS
ncbi:unnamed protein product [Calypogeia fissa]